MKYQDNFEADTFFHIFNHSVGNESLFRNEDNFRYFLKKYDTYTYLIWETYAYCLMPNHFHFLVKIKSVEELQNLPKFSNDTHTFVMQQLSNLLNAYAKAYNIKYKRKGALFLDFTKRIAVKDDTYFSTLVNYIHQNPVHHGFCKNMEDWIYSSYQAFLSEKPSKIKRQEVLEWFGDKKSFQHFHQTNLMALQEDLEFL
jgi:REP element-mobilizing transposase RayT